MPNHFVEDFEQLFGRKPEEATPDVIETKVVAAPETPEVENSDVHVETKDAK